MDSIEELAVRINAVAAIARTGLAWSELLYERERYERIIELAAEMAEILTLANNELPSSLATDLKAGWLAQVTPGAAGYVTPKVSTAAICFNAKDEILLGKRGDNGIWYVPTGWLEVGLTPAQNIIKEVQEETGIECKPLQLIGVRDTRFHRESQHGPLIPRPSASIHNIALNFLCEALSDEIKLHPLETQDAGFFSEEEALKLIPERAGFIIEHAFAFRRGETTEVYFDY